MREDMEILLSRVEELAEVVSEIGSELAEIRNKVEDWLIYGDEADEVDDDFD